MRAKKAKVTKRCKRKECNRQFDTAYDKQEYCTTRCCKLDYYPKYYEKHPEKLKQRRESSNMSGKLYEINHNYYQ